MTARGRAYKPHIHAAPAGSGNLLSGRIALQGAEGYLIEDARLLA